MIIRAIKGPFSGSPITSQRPVQQTGYEMDRTNSADSIPDVFLLIGGKCARIRREVPDLAPLPHFKRGTWEKPAAAARLPLTFSVQGQGKVPGAVAPPGSRS